MTKIIHRKGHSPPTELSACYACRACRSQRAQSVQDICQRYYVLDYKYHPPPSPPLVCLRSGLWLPIRGNSTQYFAVPHCSFSSTGSRPGRGDFRQQCDMIFFSNVLVVCFSLFCFKARQSWTPDAANALSGRFRGDVHCFGNSCFMQQFPSRL